LTNGDRVKSRTTFLRALQEIELREGIDYIISDHQAAVDTAKLLYHPELCDEEDLNIFRARLQYYFERQL